MVEGEVPLDELLSNAWCLVDAFIWSLLISRQHLLESDEASQETDVALVLILVESHGRVVDELEPPDRLAFGWVLVDDDQDAGSSDFPRHASLNERSEVLQELSESLEGPLVVKELAKDRHGLSDVQVRSLDVLLYGFTCLRTLQLVTWNLEAIPL